MQKNFLFIVLILLVSSLSFSSCNKDDEETKTDLLASRWEGETVTTNATLNGVAFPVDVQDLSGSFIEFKSNGTYTSDDNGTFDGSGTWKFSNGEKDVIFDEGTDDETTFTITSLSSSDLKLSYSEEETEDGLTISVTVLIDLKK
ncbi:lipocalin family protein [Bernardetia sp. OM2101]|uniref:lipocalin family protein n=1 Tax=Bernardetia sp. OM2101 TaxID=3344876 RepID=UPI0035D12B48